VKGERHDLKCPECGERMVLRSSKFGLFYGCSRYPKCRAAHGANADGSPLGVPADAETRAVRHAAHEALDAIWGLVLRGNGRASARREAYRWLRHTMGMRAENCHIASFDKETCERVVMLCKAKTEVRCCVCGRLRIWKRWFCAEPSGREGISHSYCPDCLARERQKLERHGIRYE